MELILLVWGDLNYSSSCRNALTRAAHGTSQASPPLGWCTVNKPLSTLTGHGWWQQPRSAQAPASATLCCGGSSPCGWGGRGAAQPGCQWRLRPRRKSLCGKTMSCSHCSAAPPGRTANTGRLGVGARCGNATTVMREKKVGHGSGMSFQNKTPCGDS